ncbi:Peptidase U35, phage prohead HK97 [gut metagenome]|uniref:Peptidase U35, phage prohead HK97 n=1 Tax=gut metagenome TaxID=749906 RepID=J9CVM2_9ZZZZ
MNVDQYCRNPVLLYMHQRGNVIGYVKDLRVENGEVTGELVFDEATDLSKRCKKQFEFGSLRMVSAGIDILELSEQPDHLVQGQTCPTITKSKLYEVSLVDVGSNDDAIVLMKDGKQITLGKDGDCPLPLINNQKTKEEMELKILALQLGLPETATEAEVTQALNELKAAKAENATLKGKNEQLTLAHITGLVEKAMEEKRLGEDKKAQFIELGKKVGADELKNVLDAMQPQMKLSTVLKTVNGRVSALPTTYAKLSEVPADTLLKLRSENPDEYKRLYKAEYGMECEL